jgi:hypothetical protein
MSVRKLSNFINGRPVPPADSRYMNDIAPSTSTVIAEIPRSNARDASAGMSETTVGLEDLINSCSSDGT